MQNATIILLHYGDHARTQAVLDTLIPQANENGASVIVCDNSPEIDPFPDGQDYVVVPNPDDPALVDSFIFATPTELFSPVLVFWTSANVPHENCLTNLLRAFDDSSVGIAAPSTNDPSGVLQGYEPDFRVIETRHVDNAVFAMSKAMLDSIGGVPDAKGNENPKNWYWNRLACYLARQAGYKVVAVRGANVTKVIQSGNPEADCAGYAWICERLGDKVWEAL